MEAYLDRVEKKDKRILFRLLQYSLFEESATDLNEMNDEGLYTYKWFDRYFTDDDRLAFFIKEKVSYKLLGFVMINEYVQRIDKGHSIAEFMILPKYRRKGIGKQVAIECFTMFDGNWEVSPSYGSEKAYLFWKNAIDTYTNRENKYEDQIFIFEKRNDK